MKKKSKTWLAKQKKDQYFIHSKIQGYRSRSAFKLLEMNKKFKLFKKKSLVLDLGSAPGGWSQVVEKEVKQGKILAVDILKMKEIINVKFLKGDFMIEEINSKIISYFNEKADIVLSDMAANTSGNKEVDSYRTGEICMNAMDLSLKILKTDGAFLSKIFMGSIYKEINEKAKKSFKTVINYKPLSSKKESKEIYIFCKGVLKYDK